ncbi:hypothetical protein CYMTET_49707 [Cymbomonas tetramitiformis]|uniref:Uncharacterized protein n=1 Tax=Cymbomonas tetramitiformis TaxID=36881 RepID=A0AAE0BPM9_9CHLO|nr:hypothetical protein CYMTET_49707 [Cymbomonas tetramitiformis]
MENEVRQNVAGSDNQFGINSALFDGVMMGVYSVAATGGTSGRPRRPVDILRTMGLLDRGRLQPQQAALGPQQPTLEPQQAALEPQRVALEPQQAALEPQQAALEPQQAALEPQQAAPNSRSRAELQRSRRTSRKPRWNLSSCAEPQQAAPNLSNPRRTQRTLPNLSATHAGNLSSRGAEPQELHAELKKFAPGTSAACVRTSAACIIILTAPFEYVYDCSLCTATRV